MIISDGKYKDNDYFMLAYRVLAYLYGCLKSGTKIRKKYLQPCHYPFEISRQYWNYVLTWLNTLGYISGVGFLRLPFEDESEVADVESITITPNGIEYLLSDHIMRSIAKQVGEDFRDK